MNRAAALVGVGHPDWVHTRNGEKPTNSFGYGIRVLEPALEDAGLQRDDIDGSSSARIWAVRAAIPIRNRTTTAMPPSP